MTDTILLRDITMLEAHANEALKIAARLKQRLQPVSTGRSKKKGLSEEMVAKMIARKRKNQLRLNQLKQKA